MRHLSRTARLRAAVTTLAVAGALGITAAATTVPAQAHGEDPGQPVASRSITPQQLQLIHQATKKFKTTGAAEAAGFVGTDVCTELPGVGGMGYHYVNYANVLDGVVDPAKPDVLVFVPTANGGRALGAAEYMGVDPDQDVTTDDGRPYLFDSIPFNGPMLGHEPGMPVHYDLHVWLYKHNSDGILASWNPAVTC